MAFGHLAAFKNHLFVEKRMAEKRSVRRRGRVHPNGVTAKWLLDDWRRGP